MRTKKLCICAVALALATVVAVLGARHPGSGAITTKPVTDRNPRPPRAKASLPPPRLTASALAATPPAEPEDARWVGLRDGVVALENRCRDNPPCDGRKLLMEEAGVAIDSTLGPKHPKRAELVEIVGWSYDERGKLGQRFHAGEFDRRRLFELLDVHLREFTGKLGAHLSDAEYEEMFHLARNDNPAQALGITPQKAAQLDAQHGPKAN
jgi:hypothetical protein